MTPYSGHATGYVSQRAAYLVALSQLPELVARLKPLRALCSIEGINLGSGNPGRIDLKLTREVQLKLASKKLRKEF